MFSASYKAHVFINTRQTADNEVFDQLHVRVLVADSVFLSVSVASKPYTVLSDQMDGWMDG